MNRQTDNVMSHLAQNGAKSKDDNIESQFVCLSIANSVLHLSRLNGKQTIITNMNIHTDTHTA